MITINRIVKTCMSILPDAKADNIRELVVSIISSNDTESLCVDDETTMVVNITVTMWGFYVEDQTKDFYASNPNAMKGIK